MFKSWINSYWNIDGFNMFDRHDYKYLFICYYASNNDNNNNNR